MKYNHSLQRVVLRARPARRVFSCPQKRERAMNQLAATKRPAPPVQKKSFEPLASTSNPSSRRLACQKPLFKKTGRFSAYCSGADSVVFSSRLAGALDAVESSHSEVNVPAAAARFLACLVSPVYSVRGSFPAAIHLFTARGLTPHILAALEEPPTASTAVFIELIETPIRTVGTS